MEFSPEEINKLRAVAKKQAEGSMLNFGKTLEEIAAIADKKVGPKLRKHHGKVAVNIETPGKAKKAPDRDEEDDWGHAQEHGE